MEYPKPLVVAAELGVAPGAAWVTDKLVADLAAAFQRVCRRFSYLLPQGAACGVRVKRRLTYCDDLNLQLSSMASWRQQTANIFHALDQDAEHYYTEPRRPEELIQLLQRVVADPPSAQFETSRSMFIAQIENAIAQRKPIPSSMLEAIGQEFKVFSGYGGLRIPLQLQYYQIQTSPNAAEPQNVGLSSKHRIGVCVGEGEAQIAFSGAKGRLDLVLALVMMQQLQNALVSHASGLVAGFDFSGLAGDPELHLLLDLLHVRTNT